MKRTIAVQVLLSLTALGTMGSIVGTHQLARAQILDSGSPTPTVTVTPGPTTTPTVKPKARAVWRMSVDSMAAVSAVHADGILTSATDVATLVADCDSAGQKLRLRVELKSGAKSTLSAFDLIVVGNGLWLRGQYTTTGVWSDWKPVSGDIILAFLPMFAEACGTQFQFGKEVRASRSMKNVGTSMVDGFTTWHLQVKQHLKGETYAVNVFVDQTTHFWVRHVTRDIKANPKDSSIADMHYSKFNEPVDISPPTTGASGSSTRHDSRSRGVLNMGRTLLNQVDVPR